jgi:excinuclease ABC subunit A
VGTVTEIYDYLRLLYARIGIPHCPVCGKRIAGQTLQAMVDHLMELKEGTKVVLIAPFIRDQKGEHKHIFEQVKKAGFARVRVDGTIMDLNEAQGLNLDKQKKHTIDVVVDRITINAEDRGRVSEGLEKGLP